MTRKPPSDLPAIRTTLMPKDTNAYGSIFGGVILSLIDLAAFIEAERQAPHLYLTVAMDKVEFHRPVKVGDIVTLWADTLEVGRTSIRIRVRVRARARRTRDEIEVTSAEVTMVAVDDAGHPVPIFASPVSV